MEEKRLGKRRWEVSPTPLWPVLRRLSLGLGLYLALLGLGIIFCYGKTLFLLWFIIFTLGFFGLNWAAFRARDRLIWRESGALLFNLGQIIALVLATGGAGSPLLFLFFIPVFIFGFRLGWPASVVTAAVISLFFIGIVFSGMAGSSLAFSSLLGPMAVFVFLWVEAVVVGLFVRYLEEEERILKRLARYDPLTGLLNRWSLYETFTTFIAAGKPFGILLFDLDGFKAINDRYGHLFGDKVLKRLADELGRCVGPEMVGRYGGDEFAVVIPGGKEEGLAVLNQVEEALRHVAQEMIGDPAIPSLSAGLALWPVDGGSYEELLQVADRRLYGVKRGKTEPTIAPGS